MKIVWSPRARLTFFRVLEYLAENWSQREVQRFYDRTDAVLKLVSQSPRFYPYSAEIDAHKCVVVSQVSLFYQVRGDSVELLVFWDNRQDPAKLFGS